MFIGEKPAFTTRPVSPGDNSSRPSRLSQPAPAEQRFDALGELLFSLVRCARALELDPELALRRATSLFRAALDGAEVPR